MKVLKTIKKYFFYCGIDRDEFKAIKKDMYVSNFKVWRILHLFMAAFFTFFVIESCLDPFFTINLPFYLALLVYSVAASVLFFVLKKDSLIAQLLIYLSISLLFLVSAIVSQNHPEAPATAFIVLLIVTPMFMIDKPIFMSIELIAASSIFLVWMYNVKEYSVWHFDILNIIFYTVVGLFLHVVANSIRIREFVLTRKISIQKDTDDLTGIKNKGAVTREINRFLADESSDKGMLFLLDVDRFKSINDTYGHDVGDSVIRQLGEFLAQKFTSNEIVGRFGGDEFLIFVKDSDSREKASETAKEIIAGASDYIELPDKDRRISLSIGIAIYNGVETNYSEIFKKADTALYETKADRQKGFHFYGG